MRFNMGILGEDASIAHTLAFLFEENFLPTVFDTEEELFLWLEECGDDVDTLIVDCRIHTRYDGLDVIATIADPSDGWPNIKSILMGPHIATYENKTDIWRLSPNADYIGPPHSVEELVSIVSGQLMRVTE